MANCIKTQMLGMVIYVFSLFVFNFSQIFIQYEFCEKWPYIYNHICF